MDGSFIAYYRVSTLKQGESGLGLEAQKLAVESFLNGGAWTVAGEFTEVETGKIAARPELSKAIDLCKATGSKLLIAKLDRLSRNVHFLSGLHEEGIEFIAVDMPTASRFTVHIMAAVAEQEAAAISQRTKAALGSIKARIAANGHHVTKNGRVITRLGNGRTFDDSARNRAVTVVKAKADEHAAKVRPTIMTLRATGMSLQEVADHLNTLGVPTPRGAKWAATTVQRAEKRAA
ncbi:MAG: recombinase family protein [Brevundimonas sp.]|uniref:recombinase family protein n=1 Tax=Brevundimonas sp. TaxID=1871086 RepID=UPI00271B8C38|nr:recombinase family protein [Brevundimonas sp.]MDO9607396.1 recombinase family protein [Brevundimonas sp.]